jgi:hypothetical protein
MAETPAGSFDDEEEPTEVIVPEVSKRTIWSVSI